MEAFVKSKIQTAERLPPPIKSQSFVVGASTTGLLRSGDKEILDFFHFLNLQSFARASILQVWILTLYNGFRYIFYVTLIMVRKYLYPPIHPGKILLKEFIQCFGLNQNRLAQDISVAPRRINEIVLGKRGITADTALRLARYFGNSAFFWMELQIRYELKKAKELLGDRLEKEVKVYQAF